MKLYDKQTKTKPALKELGYTDKEIHLCDCGCGLYRNDVPTTTAGTPDKHFIIGHEPTN